MHLCSLHLHLATTVRYVIISEAYLFPSYSEPMCPAVHTRDTLPIVSSPLASPTLKLFQPWWSILGIFRKYRICAKLEWSCYLSTFSPFSHCQIKFCIWILEQYFQALCLFWRGEENWTIVMIYNDLNFVSSYMLKPTNTDENQLNLPLPLTSPELSQISYIRIWAISCSFFVCPFHWLVDTSSYYCLKLNHMECMIRWVWRGRANHWQLFQINLYSVIS